MVKPSSLAPSYATDTRICTRCGRRQPVSRVGLVAIAPTEERPWLTWRQACRDEVGCQEFIVRDGAAYAESWSRSRSMLAALLGG